LPIPPRRLLVELYDAAIAGALPETATRTAVSAFAIPQPTRVHIIAIGKASVAMTAGALRALGEVGIAPAGGVVVAPAPLSGRRKTEPLLVREPLGTQSSQATPSRGATGAAERVAPLQLVFGDHPVPAGGSLAAATAIGEAVAAVNATDLVLVLVSGGGSSLAAAPAPDVPGLTQADIGTLYSVLLASGADIHVVNSVRKRFARWTGGRLAAVVAPAQVQCLAVSDVPGDDLGIISSGPAVGDAVPAGILLAALRASGLWSQLPPLAQSHLEAAAAGRVADTLKPDAPALKHVSARVIVSNHHALASAADRARAAGIDEVTIESMPITGEAAIAGVRMASDLIARRKRARGPHISRCVLWGGETTVTIQEGSGATLDGGTAASPLGGRCQELALAAARSLADADERATGITLLAAGTDGRDGPTDAAGAIVDRGTWRTIAAAGRDPARDLARHDSHRALDAGGALFRPGLTGTNVMDVAIGLLL
jgi:hydroxypyruvate reductase